MSVSFRHPAFIVLGGAFAGVALTAGVLGMVSMASSDDGETEETFDVADLTPIEAAWDFCNGEGYSDTVSIGDGGQSIIVDTRGETMEGATCVLGALGTSDAIVAQIQSTTAMMGTQEAEHDGLDYRWSYHPDNGMSMTITEQ